MDLLHADQTLSLLEKPRMAPEKRRELARLFQDGDYLESLKSIQDGAAELALLKAGFKLNEIAPLLLEAGCVERKHPPYFFISEFKDEDTLRSLEEAIIADRPLLKPRENPLRSLNRWLHNKWLYRTLVSKYKIKHPEVKALDGKVRSSPDPRFRRSAIRYLNRRILEAVYPQCPRLSPNGVYYVDDGFDGIDNCVVDKRTIYEHGLNGNRVFECLLNARLLSLREGSTEGRLIDKVDSIQRELDAAFQNVFSAADIQRIVTILRKCQQRIRAALSRRFQGEELENALERLDSALMQAKNLSVHPIFATKWAYVVGPFTDRLLYEANLQNAPHVVQTLQGLGVLNDKIWINRDIQHIDDIVDTLGTSFGKDLAPRVAAVLRPAISGGGHEIKVSPQIEAELDRIRHHWFVDLWLYIDRLDPDKNISEMFVAISDQNELAFEGFFRGLKGFRSVSELDLTLLFRLIGKRLEDELAGIAQVTKGPASPAPIGREASTEPDP